MNLSVKSFVTSFFAIAILSCTPEFDAQIVEPAPKATFEKEPYEFTKVDFSKLPEKYNITIVKSPHKYPKGTLVVDPNERFIYFIDQDDYVARRYPIAVGREGFEWAGKAVVGRKSHWPDWRPTPDMLEENPDLPEIVKGGDQNPLGARALYLYDDKGRDTLFRIHGTNSPRSIGTASSSGCIRMFNEHVIDLYNRVPKGTPVVVLKILLEGEEFEYEPETIEEYFELLERRLNGSTTPVTIDEATTQAPPAEEAATTNG